MGTKNNNNILGLASSGLGADLGPKSTIFGRILKSFPGHFSLAEPGVSAPIRPLSPVPRTGRKRRKTTGKQPKHKENDQKLPKLPKPFENDQKRPRPFARR